MEAKRGTWTLYQFTEGRRIILSSGIDLPVDCMGDDLYEHLEPFLPEGKTLNDYDYEGGDEFFVAVMGKTKEDGDFEFEFHEEKQKPERCDDCGRIMKPENLESRESHLGGARCRRGHGCWKAKGE